MTTTITLNLTQEQLELLLMATTRLITYCTHQQTRGNNYAGAHIPHLVDINHQIVTQLQMLKRQAASANAPPARFASQPNQAPPCSHLRGIPVSSQIVLSSIAQSTESPKRPAYAERFCRSIRWLASRRITSSAQGGFACRQ